MRILGKMGVGLLLAALFSVPSQAAVVGFVGQLDTKTLGAAGTGVFGGPAATSSLPTPVQFKGLVNVTDTTGIITGGVFVNSAGANIIITGGSVLMTENGANDTAAFSVNVGGDALGSLSFTIQADAIPPGAVINQQSLKQFFFIPTAATFTDLANGGAQYRGSITAVPEPGSMALMLTLVGGVSCLRRRRK